uniref:Uncharacterized protein n=1 Tax=viral metagenome TaxID=1070528 RepID=A0A6M3IHZ7_9ZZZZ
MDFEALAQKRDSADLLLRAFTWSKLNVRWGSITNITFMRIMESCVCPAKVVKLTQPAPMPHWIGEN